MVDRVGPYVYVCTATAGPPILRNVLDVYQKHTVPDTPARSGLELVSGYAPSRIA